MKTCEECGNELSILSSCNHPILGKKHIICRMCYIKLDKIIEQWRSFVFTYPTIINLIDIDGVKIKNNFERTVTTIMKKYINISNNKNRRGNSKNIPEQSYLRDNEQDLFPENILNSMKM